MVDLLSTSSHTYQLNSGNDQSENIASLLLQAIESYEDSNEQAISTVSITGNLLTALVAKH